MSFYAKNSTPNNFLNPKKTLFSSPNLRTSWISYVCFSTKLRIERVAFYLVDNERDNRRANRQHDPTFSCHQGFSINSSRND